MKNSDLLIDVSGEVMQPQRVQATRGPAVKFTGKLIGAFSTRTLESQRWSEGELYQTEGGALIAVNIAASDIAHERDLVDVLVVEPGNELDMRCEAMSAWDWSTPARKLAKSLGWKLVREIA